MPSCNFFNNSFDFLSYFYIFFKQTFILFSLTVKKSIITVFIYFYIVILLTLIDISLPLNLIHFFRRFAQNSFCVQTYLCLSI